MQFYDVIDQDNASDIFNSHGIKVSHDDGFPYLTGYCYDQIASRKTDPLAIECRGIVYDSKIGEVIARPFDRFFNYGEAQDITNKVNFSNCTTSEKLDGSLVTFYYSQTYSTWMVSTKGTPTARNAIVKHGEGGLPLLYVIAEYFDINVEHYVSSRILEGGVRYIDMSDFNSVMRHLDEILEPNLNKDYTYICELTSPYNTVVTQYNSTSLHLIGVRHADGHYIHEHNDLFMKPKTIQCDSLDDVRDAVAKLNHLNDNPKEGFVVTCNDTGIKVKFKNTVYLTIHRNLGSEELSDKTIKEVVADGEESEVGAYFPDMESKFKDVVSKREVLIANIQKGLDLYHSTDDRKSLVDDLKELGIASFVFAAGKDGITNAREAWGKVNKKLRVNSL